MKAEVWVNQSTRAVALIPESLEEWQTLQGMKHLHPMLPGVGSSLFLTDAPYMEPDADSPKERASGSVLKMPAQSLSQLNEEKEPHLD